MESQSSKDKGHKENSRMEKVLSSTVSSQSSSRKEVTSSSKKERMKGEKDLAKETKERKMMEEKGQEKKNENVPSHNIGAVWLCLAIQHGHAAVQVLFLSRRRSATC